MMTKSVAAAVTLMLVRGCTGLFFFPPHRRWASARKIRNEQASTRLASSKSECSQLLRGSQEPGIGKEIAEFKGRQGKAQTVRKQIERVPGAMHRQRECRYKELERPSMGREIADVRSFHGPGIGRECRFKASSGQA